MAEVENGDFGEALNYPVCEGHSIMQGFAAVSIANGLQNEFSQLVFFDSWWQHLCGRWTIHSASLVHLKSCFGGLSHRHVKYCCFFLFGSSA